MKELHSKIKSRFNKAKIVVIDSRILEINFEKSIESVIIQKGNDINCYTVSNPKLILQANNKRKVDISYTINNILEGGIFWILSQIEKNGKVMPEFY